MTESWQTTGAAVPYYERYPLTSRGRRFLSYLLEIVLIIVTLVIGWVVWWVIVWGRGQTPAKQLMGMRCVLADSGVAASYGAMALRELVGKMLLANVTCGITTLVGAIQILTDESRQALWDRIAGTVVVDDPTGQYLE